LVNAMTFARALFAFVACPGMVAIVAPLLLAPPGGWASIHVIGLAPLGAGACLLLWCVREFYVVGEGTLAPWSPPRTLVSVGPYRWSRNPMYVGVTIMLIGWATVFWSWVLLAYAMAVACAFHLRVVYFEEPWAARTFGKDWQDYRARVPRWLFRRSRPTQAVH
jgi:protein-S-isoprenylcysteine O-methyltransferase Ste14